MLRLFAFLLFIVLLVSGGCAPLPELVNDADFSSPKKTTAKPKEKPSSNISAIPSDENFSDSVLAFTPIPPEMQLRGIQAKPMPEAFQRPIRVALAQSSKVNLQSSSKVFLSVNGKSPKESSAQNIEVTVQGNRLRVKSGEETFSADSLSVSPKDSGVIQLEKNTYRGHFLFSVKSGKLWILNILSVEDYLKGVVPYEIGTLDSSRFEALKVQAVAARTYAYKQFESKGLDFDVYADTRDQVYNGISGEVPLTNAAVDATQGIILTYNNHFAETYYHSTCGGHTEGLETWGKTTLPYLRTQTDTMPGGVPFCHESSYSSWERKWNNQTLSELVKKNAAEAKAEPILQFTKIKSIRILENLPGRRIKTLEVSTDKGSILVRGDKIRWLFKQDSKILPSSSFTVSQEGATFIFSGRGFGHGIGMCQMGARARAAAGQRFSEILQFYYPGTLLEQWIP